MTTATTQLDHALDLAARGWPLFPVYEPTGAGCPCKLGTDCPDAAKHPRVTGWPSAATTDAAPIRRWWRRWPNANIGIATGEASGIVVLDVDPRHGGDDSLAELERLHGPLPETPRSLTGGGGTHYAFAHPGGTVANSTGDIAPGLDVRGDGGFIVAPGSRHASGGTYRWDAGAHPDDIALAPLPAWLLSMITGRSSNGRAAPPLPDTIAEGGRNHALASLAGTMRRRNAGYDAIHAALAAQNAARWRPPLPQHEVEAIARSVARYPPAEGGAVALNGNAPAATAPDPRPMHRFPHTDTGNAERFAARYGDRVRYDHRRARWLIWAGHWWKPDADAEIRRMAKEMARAMLRGAANVDDPDERKRAAKWAVESESRSRLDAMLALAQAERPIADAGDRWDGDPWLLGVANGVVDLRTGDLRPGRQEDAITLHADVRFDPDAECPRWLRFLEEIFDGDAELIDFVHKALGYSLTGDTSEQVFFVKHGGGANGKSTFQAIGRAALGPYAYNAPFHTVELRGRQQQTFDLADLAGRRFVTASETNESARLNEARVKALTGEDPITARRAYENFETFEPVLKLWLGVNHRPQVDDDSHAFWRRVRLIPFDVRFDGDKRDQRLKDKLRDELPGVLAWAVRGCLAWQEHGLDPPDKVRAATERYREDSDTLAAFIAERCIVAPNVSVAAAALYRAYTAWARAQGTTERDQLKATAFGRRMGERFVKRHTKHGAIYQAIGLLEAAQAGEFSDGERPPVTGSEGHFESGVTGSEVDPKLFPPSSSTRKFTDNPSHPSHPSPTPLDGEPCQECGTTDDTTYYDAEGNMWCELHGPGPEPPG